MHLLEGIIVGFANAMPIGPIGILCIRRALALGRKQGITTGLGGASADIIYATLAIFSIKLIADFVTLEQYWIRLCGGLTVIAIGIFTMRSRPNSSLITSKKFEHTRLFVSTFVLALTNPIPMFGYAALFSALGIRNIMGEHVELFLFIAGVFLGSLLWFTLLANIAHVARKNITDQKLSAINKIAGAILIVLGLVAAGSSVGGLSRSPQELSIHTEALMKASDQKPKPPYLQLVGHRGNISVWTVDGTYVRAHLDEEFTNYGQHLAFDCIPADEFWLDKEAHPDEQKFFIDHLLVEHRLMLKGVPYDDALEAADKAERAERKKAGDVNKLTKGGTLPDPAKVHEQLWKKLESGVSVWIVNGRLVRSVFDDDFTEGGHDNVYEFVPRNEVWIDNDLEEMERPYVLLHELHERNLMAKGWTYDKAHEDASKIEYYLRHHPNELHDALAKEGWE